MVYYWKLDYFKLISKLIIKSSMILALVEASLITPLNVTSIVFAETAIPFSGSFVRGTIEGNEETRIFQDEGNYSIFIELEL